MSARLWAFLRRDLRIARTYRAAFAGQLVGALLYLATFAVVAPVVRRDFSSEFGTGYFTFAAVGIAVSGALLAAINAFAGAVREAQVEGTLEAMLTAPAPQTQIVALLGAWPLVVGFLGAGLTLGAVAVRGDLSVDALSFLVVVIVSLVAFGALGLLAAAAVMVAKRGNPVAGILGMAASIAAGAYAPRSTFPSWLRAVARWNPMTHAIEGWRSALVEGRGVGDLGAGLWVPLVLAVVAVPVAWWALRAAIDRARRDGTLASY